jgi:hypothetical protein
MDFGFFLRFFLCCIARWSGYAMHSRASPEYVIFKKFPFSQMPSPLPLWSGTKYLARFMVNEEAVSAQAADENSATRDSAIACWLASKPTESASLLKPIIEVCVMTRHSLSSPLSPAFLIEVNYLRRSYDLADEPSQKLISTRWFEIEKCCSRK